MATLKVWLFSKTGGQASHRSSRLKSEDKPKIDIEDLFNNKKNVFVEKLWIFGPFSGDKGDYIDIWMIKLIWMFVFFQKQITKKNHVCP